MEKIIAIRANLKILLMRMEELVIRKSLCNNEKNIYEILRKLDDIDENLTEIERDMKSKRRKGI